MLNLKKNISKHNYEPFGKQLLVDGIGGGYGKHSRHKTWIGKENDYESVLGDFGVRKYEQEEGRFTRIDPLFEKYYGWSPYVYSMNNPIKLLDLNGKWPSDPMYNVHAMIIQEAVKGLNVSSPYAKHAIDVMIKGDRSMDLGENKKIQPLHHLTDKNVPNKEDAKIQFFEAKENNLNEFLNKDGDESWEALGRAIHQISDSHAPPHKDWQYWDDNNMLAKIIHTVEEMNTMTDDYQEAIKEVRQLIMDEVAIKKQIKEESLKNQ